MPKPVNKKTIAIDIDDTMVAEAEFIIDYSNKHWGHNLSLDDYNEHWGEMWQLDHEATERRADILHTPGMVSNFRILDDVHHALEQLSKNYRLVILTSRRKKIKQETLEWLAQNFGDVFSEVHFTGFWDTKDPTAHLMTKAELSRAIGADYLIDDQPRHCIGAANAGVKSILFGDYAQSKGIKLPKGVIRCKNWQGVLEYFDAQS